MDGVWNHNAEIGGAVIVIRDSNGCFVGAAMRNFADVFSHVQVEALAIRTGLKLVVERGIHNVVFESDSHQIILALNVSLVNLSHVGPIIEDAKSLLLLITGAIVSYIHRQANSVAHSSLCHPFGW
ncbi:uncharacterized protein [Malus domestica]|uniref:uncharacterized protein n=1 Tax=Malus domestica TaxID=3750 RepID=UPI0007ECB39C